MDIHESLSKACHIIALEKIQMTLVTYSFERGEERVCVEGLDGALSVKTFLFGW